MAKAGKKEKASAKALHERVKLLSRELEVEAALEKVRSRAMSMRSSEKLAEISAVMFRQIQALGIDATRCGVGIFDDAHDAMEVWLTTAAAGEKVMRVLDYVNLHIHPVYENVLAARIKKKPYAITILKGEGVKHYYDTMAAYMPGAGRKVFNKEEAFQSFFFEQGAINITTTKPLSEDEGAIMVRFAKVFGLIYLRFVDLQKAELQANEARVEAALERVRGRALAMQKSDELPAVAAHLYHELRQFGAGRHLYSGYAVIPEGSPIHHLHVRVPGSKAWENYSLPAGTIPVYQQIHEAWQRQEPVFYRSVGGNELKTLSSQVKKSNAGGDEQKAFKQLTDPTVFYSFNFSQGYLHVGSNSLLNDDEEALLLRLANVFELAFRRFIDIQKGEAQAREARVEAALERIRARAMAMHSSAELMEVADVLREQLAQLGQPELETSALHFYNEEPGHIISWRAFRLGNKTTGKISKGRMAIPNESCKLVEEWLENYKKGLTEYTLEVTGGKQREWYKVLFRLAPEVGEAMIKRKSTTEPRYYHFSTFSGGALLMVAIRFPSDESIYLQRRAAAVFDLAYRRFLDLKQAEELEREARIELALERVRARAMAMQRSDELRDLIGIVMDQFKELGIPVDLANFNFHSRTRDWTMWLARPGYAYPSLIHLPYIEHPLFDGPRAAVKRGDLFYSDVLTREEGQSTMKHFYAHSPAGNDPTLKARIKKAAGLARSIEFGTHVSLTISRFDAVPYSEAQNAILRRLSRVFEQAYTRFVDLQKAEAQAREAKIEAALERVRSKTMAMHKSEQLPETAQVLFEQFSKLGDTPDRIAIGIIKEEAGYIEWWVTNQQGQELSHQFRSPVHQATIRKFIDAWKVGQESTIIELTGKSLKQWIDFVRNEVHMPINDSDMRGRRVHHAAFFGQGLLLITTHEPLPDTTIQLLLRFTKVFSQAYTRFLDLQKAEAQAKEARIEASLERVRSKAMAMHNSEDLSVTVDSFFAELRSLGVTPRRCGVTLIDQESRIADLTATTATQEGESRKITGKLKLAGHPVLDQVFDHWKLQKEYHPVLRGKEIGEYYGVMNPQVAFPEFAADDIQYGHYFFFKEGGVYAWTEKEMPDEALTIYRRFTSVLSLTYRRYKDLKDAEAQAREAQIEAALERVRSRSLAMHKSAEIQDVVAVVFTQLRQLGLNYEVVGIATRIENTNDLLFWIGNDQQSYANRFLFPFTDFGAARDIVDAMNNKLAFFSRVYSFEEKNRFWQHAFEHSGFRDLPDARKQYILSSPSFSVSVAPVNGILFQLIDYSGKVATEQEAELVKRFARVFEQCYVRFQDLEKAEAQAQEAIIQASLERVRSKAMAMHNSKDLAETIHTFYKELVSLNLTPRRCGIGLIDKETRLAELSSMTTTADGISVEAIGLVELAGHPVLSKIYAHWLTKEEYHPVLRGNEIKEYYQLLRKQIAYPDFPNDAVQYGYFFFFDEGGIYAWTEKELEETELSIYRRFISVISLTYKRYKDLQVAEARAEEAVKQASLDRVRAEIASMRTADDLQRITPLIWRELTTLGVPFFRCGVMIVHEKEDFVDFYLSTPEGKPLAALHLDSKGIQVTQKAMEHWRHQTIYVDHWDREQFAAFAQAMEQQGQIQNRSSYQGGEQPPESLTLQFTPFAQGMLYVGTVEPLSAEQLQLVKTLAEAFSTAYARYEDFTRLEAAKATVEKALSELRTTQNQLVQSEKMASLGELTAGIAHEIQNPLNFVNNFSEVSKELLEEMEAELKNGNSEDALQLAKDIIQNLEKINFHGKRADGIVKSMLQHSRKSTGQKELTDINALCDEYLRLSYHGLRAKDKSFNAKFETDLDPAVGSLSVLPQEIGRVVLNLINNAFYAVSERKSSFAKASADKESKNQYEPTVTVTTKKIGNQVEIRVKDNGTGIPQKVVDKIFQPFFTTKPTGQGTGLGLSLSYDIVKAHGGTLKVETKPGEGSDFVITLPA